MQGPRERARFDGRWGEAHSVKTRRDGHTADRILDVAERLVQTRGFNAFSYADVSQAVGIRKASLHHHFSTKSQLGLALLARYRLGFGDALRSIDAGASGTFERLARYVELYASVLRRNRMCLCGMLAADVLTLPRPMRESVARFFAENEAWLAQHARPGPQARRAPLRGCARLDGRVLRELARGRDAPGARQRQAGALRRRGGAPARGCAGGQRKAEGHVCSGWWHRPRACPAEGASIRPGGWLRDDQNKA